MDYSGSRKQGVVGLGWDIAWSLRQGLRQEVQPEWNGVHRWVAVAAVERGAQKAFDRCMQLQEGP